MEIAEPWLDRRTRNESRPLKMQEKEQAILQRHQDNKYTRGDKETLINQQGVNQYQSKSVQRPSEHGKIFCITSERFPIWRRWMAQVVINVD